VRAEIAAWQFAIAAAAERAPLGWTPGMQAALVQSLSLYGAAADSEEQRLIRE
jgi:hypothetical protein